MIFDLVIFLLVISLVIFVHELGHFIFANEQIFFAMNLHLEWDRLYGKRKKVKLFIQ